MGQQPCSVGNDDAKKNVTLTTKMQRLLISLCCTWTVANNPTCKTVADGWRETCCPHYGGTRTNAPYDTSSVCEKDGFTYHKRINCESGEQITDVCGCASEGLTEDFCTKKPERSNVDHTHVVNHVLADLVVIAC